MQIINNKLTMKYNSYMSLKRMVVTDNIWQRRDYIYWYSICFIDFVFKNIFYLLYSSRNKSDCETDLEVHLSQKPRRRVHVSKKSKKVFFSNCHWHCLSYFTWHFPRNRHSVTERSLYKFISVDSFVNVECCEHLLQQEALLLHRNHASTLSVEIV